MRILIHLAAALSALLVCASMQAQEGGLDIRAGRAFSLDGRRTDDGGPVCASVTYHKGFGAVAFAADLPVPSDGSLGLQARAGFHAGIRRVCVNPFVNVRCSWRNGPEYVSAGYGAAASMKVLGPIAVFTEFVSGHDMHRNGGKLEIETKGRTTLSIGLQLSI